MLQMKFLRILISTLHAFYFNIYIERYTIEYFE